MQHTNITQTRRIKRELTCLAQLFIFSGLSLLFFPAGFNFLRLTKHTDTTHTYTHVHSSSVARKMIQLQLRHEASGLDNFPNSDLGNLLTYFLNQSLRLQLKHTFHVNEILNRKLQFDYNANTIARFIVQYNCIYFRAFGNIEVVVLHLAL